jgi:universal stress protein F
MKILCPVDLEQSSSWHRALPEAVAQAKAKGGKVFLMTVVPHLAAGIDWRYAIRGEMHGSEAYDIKSFVDQAEVRLDELMREQVPEDLRGGTIATHGTIYHEILQVAEELPADLIVMASHRPSLKDYLLGPNAARVARHARCAVFIVREDEKPPPEADSRPAAIRAP